MDSTASPPAPATTASTEFTGHGFQLLASKGVVMGWGWARNFSVCGFFFKRTGHHQDCFLNFLSSFDHTSTNDNEAVILK